MALLGRTNRLDVVKKVDFGLYLDGGRLGEILLPKRYAPEQVKVGDSLDVFVYLDSEDRPIATTEQPRAMVGETRLLKVVEVNRAGAFLDWGLPKDLLVPYGEQAEPMEAGKSYVVHLYLDRIRNRITASSKLQRHLPEGSPWLKPGQQVELLIWGETKLGYKAVVDGGCLGLLFHGEVFRPLGYGDRVKGWVKSIRPDGKLDLTLRRAQPMERGALADRILRDLRDNGGVSTLTDRSSPDEIQARYHVSKGSYKKALGALYKKRLIVIEKDRILLAGKEKTKRG